MTNAPILGNGKICYIELPAIDISASVDFYTAVFGWKTRQRGDGSIAFDDTVGQVSGTWKTDRKAISETGLLVYIMVDDAAQTLLLIEQHGGRIVKGIGADHPKITARFADPAGNILGIYQEPS